MIIGMWIYLESTFHIKLSIMKILLSLITILISSNIYSQEISKKIPFWNGPKDTGKEIIVIHENEFLISIEGDCQDLYDPLSNCIGIVHINANGEILNKILFNDFSANIVLSHQNNIKYSNGFAYTYGYTSRSDSSYFYLYKSKLDGSNKILKKITHNTESHLDLFRLIYYDDYILVNGRIKNESGHRYFFYKFDYEFKLIYEKYLPYDLLDLYDFSILRMDDEFVSSAIKLKRFDEGGFKLFHFIERFDNNFELVEQKVISENIGYRNPTKIIKDEDGYIYVTNQSDVSLEEDFAFPYPSIITKLSPELEVVWEHVFLHRSSKDILNVSFVNGFGIVGAGISSYFYLQEEYENRNGADGWAFLINFDGNIMWERLFLDPDSTIATYVGAVTVLDEKLYFTGQFNYLVENPDPYINDIDTWLVSLDLNGCWNSNCEDLIIINGDSTNFVRNVLLHDIELKLYPNPTNEILVIEHINFDLNSNDQYLQIVSLDAKVLLKKEFNSPKTILNFRGMAPGVYFVNIVSKGVVVKSEKFIIQ